MVVPAPRAAEISPAALSDRHDDPFLARGHALGGPGRSYCGYDLALEVANGRGHAPRPDQVLLRIDGQAFSADPLKLSAERVDIVGGVGRRLAECAGLVEPHHLVVGPVRQQRLSHGGAVEGSRHANRDVHADFVRAGHLVDVDRVVTGRDAQHAGLPGRGNETLEDGTGRGPQVHAVEGD